MTEIKKEEINLEEIENAIGGETTKEDPKPIKKTTTTKKKTTFEEKSAEAAATAALKAVIETNNEVAIRESEKAYFIEKQRHMLDRCKNDKKVTRTISKLYAPIVGSTYTFAYNGIPVTIYCDGKPHEYPEFIAKKIDSKLAKISESNTYKEVIDERLDQGTY